VTLLTIGEALRCSVWHPAFDRGSSIRQQWVRRLAQTEAGQALGKFRKLDRELGLFRGLEFVLTLSGMRGARQRFSRHSCIASEKEFGWGRGGSAAPFKDGAEKMGLMVIPELDRFP
jgi:hypothetical protein